MTNSLANHNYQSQLEAKRVQTLQEFGEFDVREIDVFSSPERHYRMRAEFRAWHTGDKVCYAMFQQGRRSAYEVTEFAAGSPAIQRLMPQLLRVLNETELLRIKLFQIEFLTSTTGDALITLIYHKRLDDVWLTEARRAASELNAEIVGRSRNQKLTVTQDYITECFTVAEREFRYQQLEGSFTQPNGYVCGHMLNWAVAHSADFGGDLLELYCGNGNFTLPLSRNFQKVLATEVAKSSIQSALTNCALNQICNITFVRMSSEDICGAFNNVRTYERLKQINLADYQFSTVFVDPPRAGLDTETNAFIQQFDKIIYISCNPQSLRENLRQLRASHRVTRMALFDQFPYTEHRECGVILQKL